MAKLGVLGVGNTLKGDDGIGPVLVNRLGETDVPDEVEFFEVGTSGMNILHYLKDLDTAIIVDALGSEGEPGDSVFFRPDEVEREVEVRSTHGANLLEAIELSETVGERPEVLVIMGIIPEDISIRDGLSPTLQDKLPELEEELKNKVLSLLEEGDQDDPSS